jgi:hypothetical protein
MISVPKWGHVLRLVRRMDVTLRHLTNGREGSHARLPTDLPIKTQLWGLNRTIPAFRLQGTWLGKVHGVAKNQMKA